MFLSNVKGSRGDRDLLGRWGLEHVDQRHVMRSQWSIAVDPASLTPAATDPDVLRFEIPHSW
jgi:hypothetical protein